MPFTIGGDWIPSEPEETSKKSGGRPVKVYKEKRRQGFMTLVKNLSLSDGDARNLTSDLKKRLGCGGAFKEGLIQLQGERVDAVREYLQEKGYLKKK